MIVLLLLLFFVRGPKGVVQEGEELAFDSGMKEEEEEITLASRGLLLVLSVLVVVVLNALMTR